MVQLVSSLHLYLCQLNFKAYIEPEPASLPQQHSLAACVSVNREADREVVSETTERKTTNHCLSWEISNILRDHMPESKNLIKFNSRLFAHNYFKFIEFRRIPSTCLEHSGKRFLTSFKKQGPGKQQQQRLRSGPHTKLA